MQVMTAEARDKRVRYSTITFHSSRKGKGKGKRLLECRAARVRK